MSGPQKGTNVMTYDEATDATVTKLEALAEIEAHGIDPEEFLEEMGNMTPMPEPMCWLGLDTENNSSKQKNRS